MTSVEVVAMEMPDAISQAREVLTVRRVFGEPYERDGVTVIPAASVRGGGGGGGGEGPPDQRQGRGWGGGLGVNARPVGAYVVRGGEVTWVPAVDVTQVVLRGQMIVILLLLIVRQALRRRARREFRRSLLPRR